jgi:hypothetical protein
LAREVLAILTDRLKLPFKKPRRVRRGKNNRLNSNAFNPVAQRHQTRVLKKKDIPSKRSTRSRLIYLKNKKNKKRLLSKFIRKAKKLLKVFVKS